MIDKENNNVFKFSLVQGDTLLCERVFSADNFNPFTRYSIDIRDILPRAITKFQKLLSKRNYDVCIDVGFDKDGEDIEYNMLTISQNILKFYPKGVRDSMRYNPQPITQQIDNKVIRGVPCKVGLYINDNPIVEREFFVDGFNSVVKYSIDVIDLVTEISNVIEDKIKKSDIVNMWDDYDLINYRGLTIGQIRELTPYRRSEMIRQLKRR